MSGVFSRNKYDQGAFNTSVKQATDPLKHILDPVRNDQCSPCRVSNPGFLGSAGVSITHQRPLVDVESELLHLPIKNTDDPNAKYQPTCPQCGECMQGYPCGTGVVKGCKKCRDDLYHLPDCNFQTDYTRYSNPICTARGVGINRFQPLCLNPQDEPRWLPPSEVNISYRLVVKDNHVPCIPKPLSQTAVWPNQSGGQKQSQTCPMNNTCGVFRAPLHKHQKTLNNRKWNQ